MNRSEAGKLGRVKAEAKFQARLEANRKEYLANPKRCKHCDASLSFEDKRKDFCNHSCSASYINKIRDRKVRVVSDICQGCSAEIIRNRSKRYNKYCSDCITNNKHITIKKQASCDFKSAEGLRRFLLRTRPYVCEICKLTEWNDQPITLQVDHINGNWQNNEEDNLRLLCPNCHSQTPTFGAKNRGNGRDYRRDMRKRQKQNALT